MADENTPVVIPPDKPEPESTRFTGSGRRSRPWPTDIDPARLQSLMDDFQWYHSTRLGAGVTFPNRVEAHW